MLIFDGHNDTLTRFYAEGHGSPAAFFEESDEGHIDLPRARRGGLAGGLFAIMTPPPPDSPERQPMYGLTFTENGYDVSPRSPVEQPYAQTFTDAVIDFAYALE